MDLAIGDVVEWTSQGHGIKTTKRGTIVEVVGPSELPTTFRPWGRSTKPRGEVSFVVKGIGTPKPMYWPLFVQRASEVA